MIGLEDAGRALDRLCAHFLPDDGVVIGVPGPQHAQNDRFPRRFSTGRTPRNSAGILDGRQVFILQDRHERIHCCPPHPVDQRLQ